MKKVILSSLMAVFLLSVALPAQDNDCNESYIKAMTANSIPERYKLLKEWLADCGGKGSQYENFAYAALCTLPVRERTPQETIDFGEKAISIGGLDDATKYQVLISVASAYISLGQNLQKAKSYASQAIQIAQANKKKGPDAGDPAQWNQFIGAGHFVQGQALEKENNLNDAVTAYINSYNILKNKQILTSLAKLGQELYNNKQYADAEKALKLVSSVLQDFGTTALYAKALHRNGNKNGALSQYKKAYSLQKNGEIAYNIGLILAGNAQSDAAATDEAIQYLLEAGFLSAANSKKATELAQQLYFNNKDKTYNENVKQLGEKSQELESTTKTFNDKFGEKDEEDLTEAEKSEMDAMLKKIENLQGEIEKLQKNTEASLVNWQQLVDQTKTKLGIK
jgi:tetratricopeptide (TPR) repeat protein